mmetsp:Transcript_23951/g.67089  ORF Transcript_23951/g.67089 Transcript_23951/m.67089 type:complete len:221 (+) Transcript_23951:1258-1920(+)
MFTCRPNTSSARRASSSSRSSPPRSSTSLASSSSAAILRISSFCDSLLFSSATASSFSSASRRFSSTSRRFSSTCRRFSSANLACFASRSAATAASLSTSFCVSSRRSCSNSRRSRSSSAARFASFCPRFPPRCGRLRLEEPLSCRFTSFVCSLRASTSGSVFMSRICSMALFASPLFASSTAKHTDSDTPVASLRNSAFPFSELIFLASLYLLSLSFSL